MRIDASTTIGASIRSPRFALPGSSPSGWRRWLPLLPALLIPLANAVGLPAVAAVEQAALDRSLAALTDEAPDYRQALPTAPTAR